MCKHGETFHATNWNTFQKVIRTEERPCTPLHGNKYIRYENKSLQPCHSNDMRQMTMFLVRSVILEALRFGFSDRSVFKGFLFFSGSGFGSWSTSSS